MNRQHEDELRSLLMIIDSLNVQDHVKKDLSATIARVIKNITNDYAAMVARYMAYLKMHSSMLEDIRHKAAFIEFDMYATKKENESLKKALEDE